MDITRKYKGKQIFSGKLFVDHKQIFIAELKNTVSYFRLLCANYKISCMKLVI